VLEGVLGGVLCQKRLRLWTSVSAAPTLHAVAATAPDASNICAKGVR